MSIRLILADDHRIVRVGIRTLLEACDEIEVIAEADDGMEARELTSRLDPDVVIMDVAMPRLNGPEATRRIKADMPHVKVIALSMHGDNRFVSRMLRAGASGYVLKICDAEELVRAVKVAVAGGTYLSPQVASAVVENFILDEPAESPSFAALSDREREVLQMLAEGMSAKQIGAVLHVSSRTIDSHRQRIMEKLDLHSLPELTKYAVREGLTPLEA